MIAFILSEIGAIFDGLNSKLIDIIFEISKQSLRDHEFATAHTTHIHLIS